MSTVEVFADSKECQDYFYFLEQPAPAPILTSPPTPCEILYFEPRRNRPSPAWVEERPEEKDEPDYMPCEALQYWYYKTILRTQAVYGLLLVDRLRFERLLAR